MVVNDFNYNPYCAYQHNNGLQAKFKYAFHSVVYVNVCTDMMQV